MSDVVAEHPVKADGPVLARLSRLDRFLPVWIVAAMVAGLVLGRVVPGLAGALNAVKVGSTSLAGHPAITANVAPNTTVAVPGVGTLYLHRVIRSSHSVTVRMIELVLTSPVNGLAAGTDIKVGVAYTAAS